MSLSRRRLALLSVATTVLVGAGILTAATAQAAVGCQVTYSVTNQWPGGFGASVTINNLGDPLNGWQLRWTFTAGQTISQIWSATSSQSGGAVTATNVGYNASVPTNGSTSFGFNGTWNNSSNPAPAGFSINNVPCTGSTTVPTTSVPTTAPPTTRPPTTAPPTTAPPTSNPPTNTTGLVGWATQGGGTTGGAGGATVTVTSLSALTTAAAASGSQIIRVSGNFTCSADVRVAANKTILGVGSSSGLTGCGLNISDVSNVIVRNMRISFVPAGNGQRRRDPHRPRHPDLDRPQRAVLGHHARHRLLRRAARLHARV